MRLTIEQIAEAFSRHEFSRTYPYLLDTIQWNLVGNDSIVGKERVIEACEQSATYLKTVDVTFRKFFVVPSDNCVVIDSIAAYVDVNQHVTQVASCDLYLFADGKMTGITSYTIELNNQDQSED
ncbi:hypothetical protein ACFSUS_13950 [Spirosoma soli]|uniref:Nuclear transport factor 2 family protein n=1 Tax=Spirosoma soli TaxID=1770529 RepID=A0ABW5M521_9BACT